MSLTESDKVVLTKYPIAPSKCVVCLRSANGDLNFIDFQMSLDIYGSVNICVDCVRSVAPLVGLVDATAINEANDQIRNLVETNRELYENNERLNSTIDSLVGIRPNLIERDLSAHAESIKDNADDDHQLTLELAVEGNNDRKSTKPNASGRPKNPAFATDADPLTFNI